MTLYHSKRALKALTVCVSHPECNSGVGLGPWLVGRKHVCQVHQNVGVILSLDLGDIRCRRQGERLILALCGKRVANQAGVV